METQFVGREFTRYFNLNKKNGPVQGVVSFKKSLNEIFSSKIEWTTGKQYFYGELIASLTST